MLSSRSQAKVVVKCVQTSFRSCPLVLADLPMNSLHQRTAVDHPFRQLADSHLLSSLLHDLFTTISLMFQRSRLNRDDTTLESGLRFAKIDLPMLR